MSMVQQLISAVSEAERQLEEKIVLLSSYMGEIDNFTKMANELLANDPSGLDQSIISSAEVTRKQVTDTIEKLQIAKSRIEQLKLV